MANGWYGFYLDPPTTERFADELRRLAGEYERPAELGPLEFTITPAGRLDKTSVARYEQLGIERLVLLPQPDAAADDRHRPVPLERIKRNIDAIAEQFIPS
jgi:hypothetical protein